MSEVEIPRRRTADHPLNVPTRYERATQLTLGKRLRAVPVLGTLCGIRVVVEQVEGQGPKLPCKPFELLQLTGARLPTSPHRVVVVPVQLLGLKREPGPAAGLVSHCNEEVGTAPTLGMFRSRAEPKTPGALVWKHVQHKQISQRFFAEAGPKLVGETQRGPSALSDAFGGSHVHYQDEEEGSF